MIKEGNPYEKKKHLFYRFTICDGGIVAPGDSADSVKEKCGEPQQVLTPDPQEPVKWVYDFGGTYHVSIVNGKVERIQVGE
jgi:hypothetical protein